MNTVRQVNVDQIDYNCYCDNKCNLNMYTDIVCLFLNIVRVFMKRNDSHQLDFHQFTRTCKSCIENFGSFMN